MIGLILLSALVIAADDSPTYERDVRPILARKCTICHQAKKLEKADLSGGLALDSYEAIMKGGKDHAVVTPGKSAASPLFLRLVDPDEDRRMPQLESPLAKNRRELIRRWIDAGAPPGEPARTAVSSEIESGRKRDARAIDVTIPIEPPGKKADVILARIGPLPAVTALAFRPDGGEIAVGTEGRVVLWDVAARSPVATIDADGPVHALAFSRDGRRLAVGAGQAARSGSVRVYTIPDGTLLHDFVGHGDAVYSLAFRPDGTQLASAGFDATIRFWNLADGRPAGVFAGHSDFVYEIVYSPDGRTMLSASKDRSVKRFDVATMKGLRTYSDHDADVLALALRPDGSEFVSAGDEPQLRWWKSDAERPHRKQGGHSGPVFALTFSGDGRTLISASGDKTVRLWDGRTGAMRKSLPGPTEWQYAVALSFDGSLAAGGGWDGLVRIWDAETGKLRATLAQPPGGWLGVASDGSIGASAEVRGLVRRKSGETSP